MNVTYDFSVTITNVTCDNTKIDLRNNYKKLLNVSIFFSFQVSISLFFSLFSFLAIYLQVFSLQNKTLLCVASQSIENTTSYQFNVLL